MRAITKTKLEISLQDSTPFSLREYIQLRQNIINAWLHKVLPPEDVFPPTIHKAMHYSLMAGGKRLRPILAIAAAEAISGSLEEVLPFACALEMIHTYSLIHDDLPAMDNDDLRRGIPTCHKAFGEGIAILAGDALLTYAFSILSDPAYGNNMPPDMRLLIIGEIAKASGTEGMIGGQVLDLEAQNKSLTLERLSTLHRLKTGRLIEASVRIGALSAKAREREIEDVSLYGKYLGLAFQIADDILDLEGTEEILGKTAKSDLINHKATYPALIGLDASKEKAKEAVKEALKAIEGFDGRAEPLREIALYTINRKN